MRVLVTGHLGFVGSHVFRFLSDHGCDVVGYDWPDNLCELGSASDFDVVVNLAAIGGAGRAARSPTEVMRNNVGAAIALRGALRTIEGGVFPKVVHVSSFSVYGNAPTPTGEEAELLPMEIYGASKLAQELCWIGYKGPLTILRLSSVYGPGMHLDDPEATVMAKIAKCARDKSLFDVFEDGEQTRDFVHVYDVVDSVWAVLDSAAPPPVVNVCSGRSTSIMGACNMMGVAMRMTRVSRPGDMRTCLGNPKTMIELIGRLPKPFAPMDILK